MKTIKHSSDRISWIAILQGMATVLVVMNHVRLYDATTGTDFLFVHRIREVFQPFFMATFFFVSGMLLYRTRIRIQYGIGTFYKDKAMRLVMPLLFCTVLGCAMQAVFNGVVKHPKEVGLDTFLYALVDYDSTPWPHRWYLISLVWLMLLYPCYLYVSKGGMVAEVIAGVVAIVAYFVDFTDWVDVNWCYLFTLNKHLPFFLLGIVTYKYWLHKSGTCDWCREIGVGKCWVMNVCCWAVYCALYVFTSHDEPWWLLKSVVGVAAITSTSMILAECMPRLFSSFRNYIFPIYLFGIAFQAFVELILWRKLGCPDQLVYAFYVLNVLAGIYLPVLMSQILSRIPVRLLRRCFGLS